MSYDDMPLYPRFPGECERTACVLVPVFGGGGEPGRGFDPERCRRVHLENPCRPGEWVEVLLGVDECGNLVVCVKRDLREACDSHSHRPVCRPPRPCLPEPCPPRPCAAPVPPRQGCRGRLYGSWR